VTRGCQGEGRGEVGMRPNALKASSGAVREEERPSAPRPTQARKAISDLYGRRPGRGAHVFRPRNHRRSGASTGGSPKSRFR